MDFHEVSENRENVLEIFLPNSNKNSEIFFHENSLWLERFSVHGWSEAVLLAAVAMKIAVSTENISKIYQI